MLQRLNVCVGRLWPVAARVNFDDVSSVDLDARQIRCKIVYDGPALSGKTSNLQYLYDRTPTESRSAMVHVANADERRLTFDLVPRTIAPVRGLALRLTLVTIPGSVYFDDARRAMCADADAVVFVADSQIERLEANVERWEKLVANLASHGIDADNIPGVRQFNKRDALAAAPIDVLDRALAHPHWPHTTAIAHRGEGVFDSLRIAARWVARRLV